MGRQKEINKRKNRHHWILEKLIQAYIEEGRPIASRFLVMHYKVNFSPATIRNDFQKLTEEGYLYKFHFSSGRIPTDKAWEFFLQAREKEGAIENWERKWLNKIKNKARVLQDGEKTLSFLAEQSQSFSFCYFPQKDRLIRCGWKYILLSVSSEPEKIILSELQKIADFIEHFEQRIKEIEIKRNPLILLGRYNPILPSERFSAILWRKPKRDKILGIIGNKRMPYDKNIGLLKAIARIY